MADVSPGASMEGAGAGGSSSIVDAREDVVDSHGGSVGCADREGDTEGRGVICSVVFSGTDGDEESAIADLMTEGAPFAQAFFTGGTPAIGMALARSCGLEAGSELGAVDTFLHASWDSLPSWIATAADGAGAFAPMATESGVESRRTRIVCTKEQELVDKAKCSAVMRPEMANHMRDGAGVDMLGCSGGANGTKGAIGFAGDGDSSMDTSSTASARPSTCCLRYESQKNARELGYSCYSRQQDSTPRARKGAGDFHQMSCSAMSTRDGEPER